MPLHEQYTSADNRYQSLAPSVNIHSARVHPPSLLKSLRPSDSGTSECSLPDKHEGVIAQCPHAQLKLEKGNLLPKHPL